MDQDPKVSGVSPGPEPGMSISSAGRTITEADLVGFSSLTGDWHPQHADSRWAAQSAFGERIAHGMLVLSYSVGLVGFDPERVVALRGLDSVRFKRPVRIGDTISVEAVVRNVKPIDEEMSLVEFAWTVSTAESGTAIKAKVQVLWRGEGVEADRSEPVAGAGEAETASAGSAPANGGGSGGARGSGPEAIAAAGPETLYPHGLLL